MPGYIEEAKYIKTVRGATWLVDGHGFKYRVNSKTFGNPRVYWSCVLSLTHYKCRARAITLNNQITSFSGVHNHTFDVKYNC